MSGSTFGERLKMTTFGESHGEAVGVIVEGVTPGVELNEAYIQIQMDRRRPGQSSVTTPRKEYDKIRIMSGIFEGRTTGTPLCIMLNNTDMRPSAYDDIKFMYRPGHADLSYEKKYGLRDYRGSGRASGRETAARVAAGAVARKLLERRNVTVQAYTTEIGGIRCETFDPDAVERNPVRACDPVAAERMTERIEQLAAKGDSCGGIVECRISGIAAGLGEPVFDKLDAELAKAMLSVGAIKGIEFGAGFQAATMLGSEHNDQMDAKGFRTNHAGGIIGGISTGADILFRVVVKPTSSISVPQTTVDENGNEREIATIGRHDPCICPRVVPVIEAMACMVVEDHYKRQAAMLNG
ncbi:chorismate synthase [Paenibacillus sp. UNCCL117]|uniref:chorismate synthase n=1 Tax=unclassified Paenibacillus TaxID=185978 RepID=UPI00088D69BD|nr:MULTISPECIES: chorismate synthase [unclassified Paenibacillus]SDE64259.1 chorismate synthase [Paenibacillus sp. cl123]SFW70583.1 chorismate synthase [Paenibacillus sp. UNCCL117]